MMKYTARTMLAVGAVIVMQGESVAQSEALQIRRKWRMEGLASLPSLSPLNISFNNSTPSSRVVNGVEPAPAVRKRGREELNVPVRQLSPVAQMPLRSKSAPPFTFHQVLSEDDGFYLGGGSVQKRARTNSAPADVSLPLETVLLERHTRPKSAPAGPSSTLLVPRLASASASTSAFESGIFGTLMSTKLAEKDVMRGKELLQKSELERSDAISK